MTKILLFFVMFYLESIYSTGPEVIKTEGEINGQKYISYKLAQIKAIKLVESNKIVCTVEDGFLEHDKLDQGTFNVLESLHKEQQKQSNTKTNEPTK